MWIPNAHEYISLSSCISKRIRITLDVYAVAMRIAQCIITRVTGRVAISIITSR